MRELKPFEFSVTLKESPEGKTGSNGVIYFDGVNVRLDFDEQVLFSVPVNQVDVKRGSLKGQFEVSVNGGVYKLVQNVQLSTMFKNSDLPYRLGKTESIRTPVSKQFRAVQLFFGGIVWAYVIYLLFFQD